VSANDLPVDELNSSLTLCLRGRRLEQHNRYVAKIRARDEDGVSVPVVLAPEGSRSGWRRPRGNRHLLCVWRNWMTREHDPSRECGSRAPDQAPGHRLFFG